MADKPYVLKGGPTVKPTIQLKPGIVYFASYSGGDKRSLTVPP